MADASAADRAGHVPVLIDEVMAALALEPGAHLVDGTYGAGGYAARALARGARVTGFDRDPRAIAAAAPAVARSGGRLTLVTAPFSTMAERLGRASADAVALDLGVSSMQLDDPAYGISFRADGPLDMRMGDVGPTAADFLNNASEAEIAEVLFRLGEEPASRRIARAITAARPLLTSGAFADVVRRALGSPRGQRRDPATRSFQAVRMHVNDELGELARGLEAAEAVLVPGGRLAVVSFHSLEDRMVKRFLAERSGSIARGSRHLPDAPSGALAPTFEPPTRPRKPGAAELAANPRARSAILRAARRSGAPPWPRTVSPSPEARP
ncbi:MAG: 16S rRNA (cytosine(1402)-N(4))-methyltransferase RsmH [Thermaurantiacus sp.]